MLEVLIEIDFRAQFKRGCNQLGSAFDGRQTLEEGSQSSCGWQLVCRTYDSVCQTVRRAVSGDARTSATVAKIVETRVDGGV